MSAAFEDLAHTSNRPRIALRARPAWLVLRFRAAGGSEPRADHRQSARADRVLARQRHREAARAQADRLLRLQNL